MATIISAALTWRGTKNDVLTLLSLSPEGDYLAAPTDDPDVILYRLVDEHGEPEGMVVGIEIIDFLTFDRWDTLPILDALWQLPGEKPLPLKDLLRRAQLQLRKRVRQVA